MTPTVTAIFAGVFSASSLAMSSLMSVGDLRGQVEGDVLDRQVAAQRALADLLGRLRRQIGEEQRQLQPLQELGDVLVGLCRALDAHLALNLLEGVQPHAPRV